MIPASLLKRVDVLTGGAGSVYGSDAIAGVVNFVLDADYEGFSIDTSGDFSNTPFLSAAQKTTFFRNTNLLRDTNGNVIHLTNPDGTQYQQANVTIGRRNVDGGGREADLRHTQYVTSSAHAATSTRASHTRRTASLAAPCSTRCIARLLDHAYHTCARCDHRYASRLGDARPGGVPPGRRRYRSASCVPLNIFGAAAITPAALGYVQTHGFQSGKSRERSSTRR